MPLTERQLSELENKTRKAAERNNGTTEIQEFQENCAPLLKRNEIARQNFHKAAAKARELLRDLERVEPLAEPNSKLTQAIITRRTELRQMLNSSTFDRVEQDVVDVEIARLRAHAQTPYPQVIAEGVKQNECLVGAVVEKTAELDGALGQYYARFGESLFSPSEAQEGGRGFAAVEGSGKPVEVIRNIDQFHGAK